MPESTEDKQAVQEAEPNGAAQDGREPAAQEERKRPDEGTVEYWRGRSREWERVAKQRKADAEELQGARESLEAERRRADEAGAALAAANRELAAYRVAADKGVDASLLLRMQGDDEEQMERNAQTLLDAISSAHRYPEVFDGGRGQAPTVSRETIEAIKDPVQRVNARAAHPELYRR